MAADAWAKLLTSVANLTATIFNTREEAYNRKQDKRQEKAISIAETAFGEVGKLFDFLTEIPMDEKQKKDLQNHKKLIYRLRTNFNKYD